MSTAKVAITIDQATLTKLDRLVKIKMFPSRSKAIQAAVKHGLADGTIELSDSKGRMFIVPASAVAFVEIGSEDGRRVGFIA